ncbi:MAG: MarR family transcriptional regulator [Caulobacter sp.]|nr:MarR family transcriptional regulator [Caulobacter sp.]
MSASNVKARAAGLSRMLEDLFALDGNMPVIQAMIFFHIAGRSSAPASSGASVTDVAGALGIELSRTSRNIKLLCEAGLIQSRRDPNDPRVKLNTATADGLVLLSKLVGRLS